MALDRETAAAMGRRSGRTRRNQRLTLDRAETTLGPLESLQDAQRWLRHIGLWGAAGLLPGAVLSGLVRCVEVWVKTHEATITEQVAGELRERLDDIEAQMKQRRLGVA